MIKVENICKSYGGQTVLNNLSFKVSDKSLTIITGRSGSGKSTLLNIIGQLEKPSSGKIIIENIYNFSSREILLLHRKNMGFLFQNFALIEEESVLNNLKIALAYQKTIDYKSTIESVLLSLSLTGVLNTKVYKLSGGEQQRVALARIILQNPKYILADEPTGSLDQENRNLVFSYLVDLKKKGKTIILVTHDKKLVMNHQVDQVINLV